jgi:uncharacterized protein
MRTSSRAAIAALILISGMFAAAANARQESYLSARAAFEKGFAAYRSGYYEAAIPAFEFAATQNDENAQFFAEFYLARIFADNAGGRTDHAKAYMLYQKIVNENVDLDPDDGRERVPFVAKALTALAAYMRGGLEEIGLKPDLEQAIEYLQHAATFFNDKDAQFELAKLYMRGEGVEEDVRRAMHYFSVLSQSGHAGAQAFLADLYWRGKFVPKDQQRALALITVAVENAPAHERLWIEDIYQNIFCGSSQGVRKQADGVVAVWRKQLPRTDEPGSMQLGARALQPQRTCSNGEVIEIDRLRAARPKEVGTFPPSQPLPQGATSGFGLREAGAPGVERTH